MNTDLHEDVTAYNFWHPINGRWVHLAMVRNSEGEPVYYTDGVQENLNGQ